MIYGIGVDTATAARLEKSAQRAGFLNKVFGAQEQALLAARGAQRTETMAANFAAKEAFGKALGLGIFSGAFRLTEVQALREKNGAPQLEFSGGAAALMREKGLVAHVSITHERGTATAFVVLEARACPDKTVRLPKGIKL